MEQNFAPNFEGIQYLRVLVKIDFNVPRNAAWGADASHRYEIAKRFSPHWLGLRSSHFLPKLDRLVLLNRDIEIPDAESVLIHIAIPHVAENRQWCTVNLTFENGEKFEILTSYDVDLRPKQEFITLGQEYRDQYPNAKTAMALERIA